MLNIQLRVWVEVKVEQAGELKDERTRRCTLHLGQISVVWRCRWMRCGEVGWGQWMWRY